MTGSLDLCQMGQILGSRRALCQKDHGSARSRIGHLTETTGDFYSHQSSELEYLGFMCSGYHHQLRAAGETRHRRDPILDSLLQQIIDRSDKLGHL